MIYKIFDFINYQKIRKIFYKIVKNNKIKKKKYIINKYFKVNIEKLNNNKTKNHKI